MPETEEGTKRVKEIDEPVRVLIIDDNKDHRLLAVMALEAAGYEVDQAADATTGKKMLQQNEFDVVLLDYRMPVRNGVEFLDDIKDSGLDVPVIFITGEGSEDVAVKAFTSGANDYIPKRTDFQVVIPKKVREVVTRHRFLKKVEEEMRQIERNEKRYREFFADASDAIFIADARGDLTFVNDAMCGLTGYSKKELLGTNLFSYVLPDVQESPEKLAKSKRRRPGEKRPLEFEMVRKDGSHMLVEFLATIKPEGEDSCRIEGIARDITLRKRDEAKDKALEKLDTVAKMARDLMSRMEQPTATLLGRAGDILNTTQDSEARNAAMDILNQGELIMAIVHELKKISHEAKPVFQTISLHDIISKAIESSKKGREEKAKIVMEVSPAADKIEGDGEMLRTVFESLLDNALDAVKANGEIVVSARPGAKDLVEVTISDNGVGIPGEFLQKIFDPFFTTKGKARVPGLGLTISLRCVEAHLGDIECESTLGKGSRFVVSLPRDPRKRLKSLHKAPSPFG